MTARPFAVLAAFTALAAAPAHAQLPSMVDGTPMPSLAPMVERTAPAVVNIATRGSVELRGSNPFMDDPFFRRFFDMPDQPQRRQTQSAGSGVIVDAKEGLVLTNAHVVDGADEIDVTLQDDRNFKAEVIGTDPASDIALLRIPAENLAELKMADSAEARVGDFVVAIGNPFGLGHTVTSGIISALGRSGINPEGYEDFIQTDASINPGNSGGALVNLRGELVGVNSAIISRGGGNIGIGFAIPANMARSVMDQLLEFGEVRRGLLGVNIYTITPDIAEAYGVKDNKGALVSQVMPDSAAEKAGVQAGDIIRKVDGKTIDDANALRNAVGLKRSGDTVVLEVLRDGRERTIRARLGEQAASEQVAAADLHPGLQGAELETLDASSPRFEGQAGVLVANVAPGSPAAQRGLRPGDIITGVNRQKVENLADLRSHAAEGQSLLLNIRRGNANLILPIR
ncbi:DegQ family serine endoprotease [Thioalkalivibrio sp. XN279]|uniref:DegQ family serine endoprotease n=1 Tax=Thioalkalivibrio sp. XN279 TaxID=2714953 RepID=UPI0014077C4A|nr:DegQ family serine endoprotease [Thioalkalivibrio sp. XN279]NHA14058.1 DegQ family serine endoprotease [Thioalkalivibrio sp. XN279]